MKQETLEESAKNYANYNEQINKAIQQAVIFGAKWQQDKDNKELAMWKLTVEKQEARCESLRRIISDLQERSYREEEVIWALLLCSNKKFKNSLEVKEWWNNFKSKENESNIKV